MQAIKAYIHKCKCLCWCVCARRACDFKSSYIITFLIYLQLQFKEISHFY